MFQQNNSPETWDALWADKGMYGKIIDIGRDFYNIFFRKLLVRHISPATEMIELGCGGSTLSLSIVNRMKKLVGLDHSAASIELSRANAEKIGAPNTEFMQCDLFKMPDALKNKFDFVWSQGLMEHFDDYDAVMKAHFDVAKSGATILMSLPYKYTYIYIWHMLTRPMFMRKLWPWADQKFLTHEELRILGGKFSKDCRVYLLPPWPVGLLLGIIIIEMKKQ